MKNQDVRQFAKKHGVYLWQIAELLGVSEPTMTRRMRRELNSAEREHVIRAIEHIAEMNEEKEDECNAVH